MAETETAEPVKASAPAAAEFYSDAHRDSYLRSLEEEKRGYEQRAAGAEENGGADHQDVTAETWLKRTVAVQDEINRVTGDVKAGKKTTRGRRKPVDQDEAGE